jgi:hypothetical protein
MFMLLVFPDQFGLKRADTGNSERRAVFSCRSKKPKVRRFVKRLLEISGVPAALKGQLALRMGTKKRDEG